MNTAALVKKMPSDIGYKAVKVERSLADSAQIIASHRGISIGAYLSNLIRDQISTDFEEAVESMRADIEARKKEAHQTKSKKRKPKAD